ncbi:MAG: pentapeptide repeat-containing protein [Merismopedia sp. SIO2A8]|nr:pentapeptide repeat-containing protein [Merismopedia sp. SIO2A8]
MLQNLLRAVLLFITILGITLGSAIAPSSAAWAQENHVNYTLTNLDGRDFSFQDVSGTSFAGATMRKTNFEGANLSATILTKGEFIGANLKGADLTDVFADRAFFNDSDLTNAIFIDAILTGTFFDGTTIDGADFSGAIIDRYQIYEMCKRAAGVNPETGLSTRDSLGCRS